MSFAPQNITQKTRAAPPKNRQNAFKKPKNLLPPEQGSASSPHSVSPTIESGVVRGSVFVVPVNPYVRTSTLPPRIYDQRSGSPPTNMLVRSESMEPRRIAPVCGLPKDPFKAAELFKKNYQDILASMDRDSKNVLEKLKELNSAVPLSTKEEWNKDTVSVSDVYTNFTDAIRLLITVANSINDALSLPKEWKSFKFLELKINSSEVVSAKTKGLVCLMSHAVVKLMEGRDKLLKKLQEIQIAWKTASREIKQERSLTSKQKLSVSGISGNGDSSARLRRIKNTERLTVLSKKKELWRKLFGLVFLSKPLVGELKALDANIKQATPFSHKFDESMAGSKSKVNK